MSLPKPYFERDGVTLYLGDCRSILPSLPKVDLVLTDPPYGIAYVGGAGGASSIHSSGAGSRKSEAVIGDDEPFDPRFLFQFDRVAMFGAQHFYHRLPPGGSFHVWDKRGEYKEFHTADFDTLWISWKQTGRLTKCVWRGLCRETEAQNKILHPTQKPLRVMKWAIELCGDDDTICDPFAGSGTTLRAAMDLGRKAIGIEISEKYCEIAARRLEQKNLKFEECLS